MRRAERRAGAPLRGLAVCCHPKYFNRSLITHASCEHVPMAGKQSLSIADEVPLEQRHPLSGGGDTYQSGVSPSRIFSMPSQTRDRWKQPPKEAFGSVSCKNGLALSGVFLKFVSSAQPRP